MKFMLYLIGMGLEEGDLTLKAIEAIKECDEVYLEGYTSIGPSKEYLEKQTNKKITILYREQVESDFLIKESKNKNIALLIIGDIGFATTHSVLILEAKEVKIIHGISLINAISALGLSMYKFGEITSIPFNYSNIKSPIEVIKKNKSNNLHSLILLDLDPKNNKFLPAQEALTYLSKEISNELVFICEKIGTKEQKITKGKIEDLRNKEFKLFPQCIVIPAKLNFVEEDLMKLL